MLNTCETAHRDNFVNCEIFLNKNPQFAIDDRCVNQISDYTIGTRDFYALFSFVILTDSNVCYNFE